MQTWLRRGGWAVLVACGAVSLAISCGSEDDKKRSSREGEAGQAGAAPDASSGGNAGEPSTPASAGEGGSPSAMGGAAGESPAPEAGAGGTAAVEAGGAGGEPPTFACVTENNATGVTFSNEAIYAGCRGARLYVDFNATSSDHDITCCGVSNAKPAWGTALAGVAPESTNGLFGFIVPADAPLGLQAMDVTCSTGKADAFSLEVKAGAPPVVTDVASEQVMVGDPVVINGSNLAGVTSVMAYGSEGTAFECVIDAEQSTDTKLQCGFSDVVPTGIFQLRVAQENCGWAVNEVSIVRVPIPG